MFSLSALLLKQVFLRLKFSLFNSISLTLGSRIWKFLLRTTNFSYCLLWLQDFGLLMPTILNASISSLIQWFINLFVHSSLQHLYRTEDAYWSLPTCEFQTIFDFSSLMISWYPMIIAWIVLYFKKKAIWFGFAQNKVLFVPRFFTVNFRMFSSFRIGRKSKVILIKLLAF